MRGGRILDLLCEVEGRYWGFCIGMIIVQPHNVTCFDVVVLYGYDTLSMVVTIQHS
jgi:hypothetical protein